jgi:hypothetical protein
MSFLKPDIFTYAKDVLLWFFSNYIYNLIDYFSDFTLLQIANPVQNNMAVSSKETVRSYITRLLETTGLKIAVVNWKRVYVLDDLAGYLAKNDIITLKVCNDKGRTALGFGEVREGKWNNNDIPLYKLCQAASSSGKSQSFLSDDSLAIAVSRFSLMILDFKKWTKSKTSSRHDSGTCSISWISISFLLMAASLMSLFYQIFLSRCSYFSIF